MLSKKTKTESSLTATNPSKHEKNILSKKSLQISKPQKVRSKRPTQNRKNQHTVTTIHSPSSSLNYAHKKLIVKSKSKVNKMSQQWRNSVNTSLERTAKGDHYSINYSLKNSMEVEAKKDYGMLLRRSREVMRRYQHELRNSREENRLLRQENSYLKKLHHIQ